MEKEQEIQIGNVTIYGADTLGKFTNGILRRGFERVSPIREQVNIYQIHGAPQSEQDDKEILQELNGDLAKNDNIKRIVLLHRPDEIQIRHQELKDVLKSAKKTIGLTFLGNLHLDDPFFDAPNVVREVIPHGFFEDISQKIQIDPIVIGSHTSWGEMRSTKHLIKLLGNIFRENKPRTRSIIGYIGGKPKDALNVKHLIEEWDDVNSRGSAAFYSTGSKNRLDYSATHNDVVLVDSENIEPENYGLTFNVQMYYLGNQIRTGESSGSVHSSISIPVVLEMNGSETIEDLNVIKIPYESKNDINTIDFVSGARQILECIDNGKYKEMLEHNSEQAKKFTPAYVASEYIKLIGKL